MHDGDPAVVVGAVLMGGQSRRFGSAKELATANGTPMGLVVANAFRDAQLDPVVAAGGSNGHELGLVTIPDRMPGEGPLAALASILSWAGTGGVVVAPCDLPLLRGSDVASIVSLWRVDPTSAACATVNGTPSTQLACWPASAARTLQVAVAQGRRRFRDALDLVGWHGVEVDPRSLADADDPETLRLLLDGDGDGDGDGRESLPNAPDA